MAVFIREAPGEAPTELRRRRPYSIGIKFYNCTNTKRTTNDTRTIPVRTE